MRLAKETPHKLSPHGFQSLFLTLPRSFLPRDASAHLRSFISFFSHQPRYTAAIASCDWHAAYVCAEGKDERGEEGREPTWKWKCITDDVRCTEVVDENAEADDDLFRFVMGKADTHRDARLRLFIPRGTYNTSITEDILERYARRRCSPRLEKKKERGREGRGKGIEILSPGTAAKRARSEILRTVVVLPLNFLSFLPPCVSWCSFFHLHPLLYSRLLSDAVPPITKRLTILSPELSISLYPVIQTKMVTAKCCQSGETFLDIALISRSEIRAFVTIVLFVYLIGLTTFRRVFDGTTAV